MAVDPNLDTGTKSALQTSPGLKRPPMAAPSVGEIMLGNMGVPVTPRAANPQYDMRWNPHLVGDGNTMVYSSNPSNTWTTAAPTDGFLRPKNAPAPSAPAAAPAPLGGLPQGLRRMGGMPGVYAGRMNDGSIGFTDSADGLTNFGSGLDSRGLRRSDAVVGSYSNAGAGTNPAYASANPYGGKVYGPNDVLPAGGSASQGYPQQTGQHFDQGLYNQLTDAGDPNANKAYAASSIGDLRADEISSMNPYQLQSTMGALQEKMAAERDPEVQKANHILLGRLAGQYQNLMQGDTGASYPMPGANPGAAYGMPGAGGMMGGMTVGNLLTAQKNAETARAAQERLGIEAANSQNQANAQRRQEFQDFENRVDHAGTPEQRANYLLSRIPAGDLADWAKSNEGQYVEGQLDSDLDNVSGSSWWNPFASAGGSQYGAGVRNLRFDEGPNDFTIGRPGALAGNAVGATGNFGLRRLPGSYYTTANVSKLRRLQQALAAESGSSGS